MVFRLALPFVRHVFGGRGGGGGKALWGGGRAALRCERSVATEFCWCTSWWAAVRANEANVSCPWTPSRPRQGGVFSVKEAVAWGWWVAGLGADRGACHPIAGCLGDYGPITTLSAKQPQPRRPLERPRKRASVLFVSGWASTRGGGGWRHLRRGAGANGSV